MAGGNSIQKKERARCAMIVREQRSRIERALFKSISLKSISLENKLYVRSFTKILLEIEHTILELPHPDAYVPEKPEYLGDFSVEEMERAQEIISEQKQNPFERETK